MLKLTLLWTLCLFISPLLLVQGVWVRKRARRLPEATGFASGQWGEGPPTYHVFGFGDSVIAGVGIEKLENAMTSQFSSALSKKSNQVIKWSASGHNGDRIRDLINRVPHLEMDAVDLIFVSIGVNDVSHLTSLTRWQFEITTLISALRNKSQAPIVFLGLPPMGLFPVLPQPLRFALGVRASLLDKSLRQVSTFVDYVFWVNTLNPDESIDMATDGYHPSAEACQVWSQEAVTQLVEDGLMNQNKR